MTSPFGKVVREVHVPAMMHVVDRSAPLDQAIRIRFENVYGKLTCYPVDTPAKLFAELAGTKTLTPRACVLAQRLGFSLQIENLSGELLCQFLREAQS